MRAAAPGESALLLLDVIDLLNKRKIPYAVVGAMAASIHGVVRASADADALLFVLPTRTVKDLETDLKSLGLEPRLKRGGADDPIAAVLSINDRHRNRVDLLMGLRHFPREALRRRQSVPFLGATVQVVGLEDFIAMKVYAGGPQDLDDVKNALTIHRRRVNRPLLIRLAKRYGAEPARQLQSILSAYPKTALIERPAGS